MVATNEKRLVPQLRFKEFDREWEEKRYGDIYTFYSTNSFSRDNLNYISGTVKNIHYGDIHTKFSMLFDIKRELVPYINKEINLSRIKDENYCKEGDLVIADASENYNDVGKTIELTNLNNERILAGLHTFLARPNKHNMQIGFAGYLVQSWKTRKQVMTIAQGTKVLGIATSRLTKITLDIPSLPEQQKIASFLTEVDKKLQQLTTKKEQLEDYKKGVMQQLFSQQLRFKDDDGNDFPDWEKKRLATLTNRNICYGVVQPGIEDSNGVKFIRGGDVFKGKVSKDLKIISKSITDKYKRTYLKGGELIMSLVGYPGETAIVPEYLKGANLARQVGLIDLKTDTDSLFISYYLSSDFGKKNLLGKTIGSAQQVINITDLKKLMVPYPTLKEQQKIAAYLSSLDDKIETVAGQIEKTQEFKKGLLQQMFV